MLAIGWELNTVRWFKHLYGASPCGYVVSLSMVAGSHESVSQTTGIESGKFLKTLAWKLAQLHFLCTLVVKAVTRCSQVQGEGT